MRLSQILADCVSQDSIYFISATVASVASPTLLLYRLYLQWSGHMQFVMSLELQIRFATTDINSDQKVMIAITEK